MSNIVAVNGLSFRYGERQALDDVSLSVAQGSMFALLGPNGSGKTTFFRILATLLRPQSGSVMIDECDVVRDCAAVRRRIGIVFQSPSLDVHLSVAENLRHSGHLYGLRGAVLHSRIDAALAAVTLTDRRDERVKALSGGMRRRAEIARVLLHRPQVLILDEPSTGLDPAARADLWRHLARVRADHDATILVTTHLMDEAERCDHVAIFDNGKLVITGTPDELKARIGGDCVTIRGSDLAALASDIGQAGLGNPRALDHALRIETDAATKLAANLMHRFGDRITELTIGRPTLDDVFIHETGHVFEPAHLAPSTDNKKGRRR